MRTAVVVAIIVTVVGFAVAGAVWAGWLTHGETLAILGPMPVTFVSCSAFECGVQLWNGPVNTPVVWCQGASVPKCAALKPGQRVRFQVSLLGTVCGTTPCTIMFAEKVNNR